MGSVGVRWMFTAALAAVVSVGMARAQTSAPVKDDLFAGTEKFANGASDVTEVDMDPDTLGMVSGKDWKKAQNMVLNVVKTYEYPKPGMYNIADVEEIRRRLDTGDWHCSIHTREVKSGESTDICYKHRTDGLVEQAIITVEPKELTFIHQIRRPPAGARESDGGGPGESLLVLPGMRGVVDTQMAALTPETEARLEEIGPELQAHMAALRPEMQAQIAMAERQVAAAQKQLDNERLGKSR